MQARVSRLSRVERTTSSCSECRRRKQRCNQGQPCSNCARRFPRPTCDYTKTSSGPSTNSRRPGIDGASVLITAALPSPFTEDHSIEYDGIHQPLLPIRSMAAGFPGFGPHAPSWQDQNCSGLNAGELVRWSGIDILTQFPGPATWEALPWMSNPTGCGSRGPRTGGAPPPCIAGCVVHSDALHDAVALLQARHDIPNRFISPDWHPGRTEEIVSWLMTLDASVRSTGLPRGPSGTSQALSSLPVAATRQNAELLQIFVRLISRFKACLDGNPDPNNPYIKFYVPFCIQTPLLAQVAIYTASCFLNETGHLDKTVVMSHKGLAIRMLNDLLRSSKSSTSDEAITAVIQLILDEWYWGDTNDLRAHLRGLREMIRLRGGLRSLGMGGLVSKLAVAADVAIALSFEVAPFLQKGTEFDQEAGAAAHVPFRVAYNTPLVAHPVAFSTCAEALKIHPVTASILDDMRFLITRVMGMPKDPSPTDLRKLHTTSEWIFGRISKLPANSPEDQPPMAAAQSTEHEKPGFLSPRSASYSSDPTRRGSSVSSADEGPSSFAGCSANSPRARSKSRSPTSAGGGGADFSSPQHQQASAPAPAPSPPPDFLYQAVRQAALIYCRAVMQRRPFSEVVGTADFCTLWTTMWRVSLTKWKSVLGVFGWIIMSIASCTRDTPHDRFVKSMLTIWTVQMSLDNWEIASGALRSGLKLQAWLGAGATTGAAEAPSSSAAGGSAGGSAGGGSGANSPDAAGDDDAVSMKQEQQQQADQEMSGVGEGGEGGGLRAPALAEPRGRSSFSSTRSVGRLPGDEDALLAGPAESDVSEKIIGGEKNIRERGSVTPGW